jgi:hypothetical protein
MNRFDLTGAYADAYTSFAARVVIHGGWLLLLPAFKLRLSLR